ncbi:thioredoxin family protein [Thiohalophilus thiocyanatoxydans]|uniref:Glutaredoxin n=1 Tax=Thiohalophilus thiocyanatoxydans TaxID=381308 RepID=A0A4R8IPI5_9GAMM|nr:thioredoxin family protein [Thiohalophilus thiocyanatoxydans]TDY02841.1 glutaredoxin [Thiohalophilus thiocyanatoxydans]
MSDKRQIEIFSAGCPVCQETIDLVNQLACSSCEISVLAMHDSENAARAKSLGVRSVPAVAVNGELVACCRDRGVDAASLKAAGIGQPLG